jgi:hypothetical protein
MNENTNELSLMEIPELEDLVVYTMSSEVAGRGRAASSCCCVASCCCCSGGGVNEKVAAN